MPDIRSLVEEFTSRLSDLVQSDTLERARAAVEAALGGSPGRGRPKANTLTVTGKVRKKPPRQLCPVPGCKNPAAPVFGMVCAAHKNVAKTKIKKYREARRAAKAGKAPKRAAAVKPARSTRKTSRTVVRPKAVRSSGGKRAVPRAKPPVRVPAPATPDATQPAS